MDSHFSLKFLLHELTALKKTIDELCYEGILNITQVTRLYVFVNRTRKTLNQSVKCRQNVMCSIVICSKPWLIKFEFYTTEFTDFKDTKIPKVL